MPMGKDQKAVTLRMKTEIYAVLEKIADESGKSLNCIISDIVKTSIGWGKTPSVKEKSK